MNRLTPKIAVMMTVCLLGMNLTAGAPLAIAPCPPPMCCSGPMHLDHHNSMINFSLPLMKCCEDCNNLMCGPLSDPLQDVKPVNPSSEQGYSSVLHPGIQALDLSFARMWVPEPKHPMALEPPSAVVPLYISHLSLII